MGLEEAANELMITHYRAEYERFPELQAAVWAAALESLKHALQDGIDDVNQRLQGHYELQLGDWMVHLHKEGNDRRFTSLYVNVVGRSGAINLELYPPAWTAEYKIERMGKNEYMWRHGKEYFAEEQLAESGLTKLLEHTAKFMQGKL